MSEKTDKPAILGGEPVRKTPLSYAHQWIDEEDIRAVEEVLRSDFLTCGPRIEELEAALCEATGAKYAVCCANGTAALHIACQAAGLSPGDELITTPMTFAASANCALYVGAKPVFADIDPRTWNIDPEKVKKAITKKTRVILPVDFTGQAVRLSELKELAREAGAYLIEDGAHSLGTLYEGKPVGSIADMTTFSFHAVKTITGGEGGAVATNDEKLYERLLLFRAHGITRNPRLLQRNSLDAEGMEYGLPDSSNPGFLKRNGLDAEATEYTLPDSPNSPDPWYYEQQELGMNYRMTELQAALIRSQLKKLPLFKARRKELVQRYEKAFADLPQIILQQEIPESDTARHLFILRLALSRLKIGRRDFFEALAAEGIKGNVHYIPVYRHPFYEKLGYPKGLCPEAEKLYREIITLPLYYGLSDEDADDVIRAVRKLVLAFGK